MKLAKISLATLVALGAFSSVASATPLEEAIKNVDLSGYARYRYTNDLTDVKGVKNENGRHQFKSIFSFKAALDDNFFGVLSLRYSSNDSSSGYANTADITDTTSTFGVQEFYLGYKRGATTVTAGKQVMGTYFTDDLAGTGIKIVNSDIQGLTLAAVAFDAIETGGDFDGELQNTLPQIPNVYGLAAMGSYNPVDFKLWWTNLENIANLYAADAALKFDLEAVKLGLQGQYVHNQAKHDLYSNANFFAAKADLGVAGFGINAGYISFKAKDNKLSFVTIEDNGKLINPGKLVNSVMNGGKQYYNNIMDDNKYWFVGASYKADKFGAYANYIDGEGYSHAAGFGKDTDRKEWNVGGNYRYSKKLNFSTFYAAAKDKKDGQSNKRDRIRFETRWNF
ncbi:MULTISPECIES: major outer membrane protein [unclassified Campylobacter]|uniref:major outer membrane protein n=1 Tax=unclassified Campylobacter TaxID=2593542 RepID=UPI001475B26A|nr:MULTISPECIES: major outer membrane protein [unclassified Campylobacter]